MVKLVDPSHEWATEIGRIVIAFGSIEHVTMLCLQQIPRDPIYKATSEFNLAPRLKLLLAVLEGNPDPDAGLLAQLLGDAKKLAEDRNLIVHNPLMLDVYEDSDGGYQFRSAIHSLKNAEKHLTLADLVTVREKAERLTTDLYGVSASVLERCYRAKTTEGGADV